MLRYVLSIVFALGMFSISRAEYLWAPATDRKNDDPDKFAVELMREASVPEVSKTAESHPEEGAERTDEVKVGKDERVERELSHREWLHIGLMRADFTLAARHAQYIVNAEPNDVKANFALGMKAFLDGKFATAERHLLRCAKSRGGDPAVLNNLALAEMHLGKFKEARRYIEMALKSCPNLPELHKTKDRVEQRAKEAEQKTQERSAGKGAAPDTAVKP